MQLACSLCKTYVEIGVGRGMRPSLPFVCKACKSKSRQPSAVALPSGREVLAARSGARILEPAQAPERVEPPPARGPEAAVAPQPAAPQAAIPQPVAPARAPVVRPAPPASIPHAPAAAAPRRDGGQVDPVSIRDIEMILSPGIDPPPLSTPAPAAPEHEHEHEEELEVSEVWDSLDEPGLSVDPARGGGPVTRPSPRMEKPAAQRAAPPPPPRRRPPPPPQQQRSSPDLTAPAPAARQKSSPDLTAPAPAARQRSSPDLTAPAPAARQKSSPDLTARPRPSPDGTLRAPAARRAPEAAAAPAPPPARSALASVPDPDLPPATRSHGDTPQVLDSSAADLQVMGALCPTPPPPATGLRAKPKPAGPDPSIWDVGPARGARAAEDEIPISVDEPVDSGLFDLRRIAGERAAPIGRPQAARASEDVLNLSGGLFFGSAAPVAPLTPPILTKAPASVPPAPPPPVPERRAVSPAVVSIAPAPLVSEPANPFGSRRRALAGWVLALAAVVGAAVIYLAVRGEPEPGAAAPQAAVEPQGAPVRARPVARDTRGAGPSDREPSLDDEPAPPGGPTAAPTQAAVAPPAPADSARRPEPPSAAAAPAARATSAAAAPPGPAPAPPPPAPPPAAPPPSGEFNRAAATAALNAAAGAASACKADGTGGGKVAVTFAPSGRVTSARIESGPFVGTPTGGCIATAFRSAKVPPFDGGPVTVRKQVNIR